MNEQGTGEPIDSSSHINPEASLESEAKIAIDMLRRAEERILERVTSELGPNHNPPLDYHTLEHSTYTKERAAGFFDDVVAKIPWVALGMTEADYGSSRTANELKIQVLKQLLAVICLGHDIVQDGFVDQDGVWKRRRGITGGGNEYESAMQIIAEIKKYGGDGAFTILNKFDITEERIVRDLAATFVDFQGRKIRKKSGRGESATGIQQSYFPHASFEGQCLALADLYGSYSSKDLEHSTELSFAEFREMNQWIYGLVATLKNNQEGAGVTEQEIGRALIAMRAWLDEQPGFLILNAEGLEENTSYLKKNIKSPQDKASFGRIVNRHFSYEGMIDNGLTMRKHNATQTDRDREIVGAVSALTGNHQGDNVENLSVLLRYFGYDMPTRID